MLSVCATLPAAAAGAQQPTAYWTIDTVAGTWGRGFSGDGGPAVRADLNYPHGVAADGADNLYIADSYNNRIRKVDAAGTITTIAGTGEYGFSGDGGLAVQARLDNPQGLALDGAGNLYFTDGYRIRKVDTAGIITTVAGKRRERVQRGRRPGSRGGVGLHQRHSGGRGGQPLHFHWSPSLWTRRNLRKVPRRR